MPRTGANSLEFRTIDAGNVDALAGGLSALHEAVRGERRDARYWRWCYVEGPLGGGGSAAALHGGGVVGRLGRVPVRFVVAGRRVAAALYEGLHVLPSSRSWQCYRGLVAESLRTSAARRSVFGYAFVTRSGAALSARTGGLRLGRVPFLVGVLDIARALEGRSVPRPLALAGGLFQPWLGLRPHRRGPADLAIRPVEQFDAAFDDLWQAIEPNRVVAAVRDAAYLNWRYATCPGRRYVCLAAYRELQRPEGLVVVRRRTERRDAFVLELFARDDDRAVLRALLQRAMLALDRAGAGLVAASFPAGSAEAAVVRDLGFRPWAGRLLGIELIVTPDAEGRSGLERRLSNWSFSLGDWLTY